MTEDSRLTVPRALFTGMNQGRPARELMSPQLEYVNPDDAVEPGTSIGPGAFKKITDVYEWKFERVAYYAVGDQVLALASGQAVGRGSGIPTPFNQGYLMKIEDGLLVRFEWFSDHAAARAATGVDETAEPLDVDDPP